MKIRKVVFDLDGTLVDSAPDILQILRQAVDQVGIRSDRPLTRALIGPPVRQMIRTWGADLSESQVASAAAEFRRLYDASALPNTLPYAGILECLNSLRQSGCSLFVATNKATQATRGILKRTFDGLFEDFCCVDSVPKRSLGKVEMLQRLARHFDLAAQEAVMVGDGESDIRAGKALGWRTMAVLYGYGNAHLLEQLSPNWIVSQPIEIARLLQSASN